MNTYRLVYKTATSREVVIEVTGNYFSRAWENSGRSTEELNEIFNLFLVREIKGEKEKAGQSTYCYIFLILGPGTIKLSDIS